MEFKIKKTDFLNLLRWTQGIAEKRSTMQILSNLLLEAVDKCLKVTATDLEMALVAEGAIEGRGGLRLAVNAKHLYDIVREAPQEEIRMAKSDALGVEVSSGKARFKIVGMNPDDYPQIPKVDSRTEIPMEADALSEMVENTFYAVSTDETRYTLNGLYFTQGKEDRLRVVATDGHRLSYSERPVEKWKPAKGLLVPRKGIQELKKLLAEGLGELLFSHDEKTVRFRRGPVTLLVRLIEGEFPAYEQVIPQKLDRIASIDRDLLVGAMRRASILATTEGRGVRFGFSPNLLEVTSSHPDVGETSEEIPADYKGSKFEVAFNPRYLSDVLSVLEDKKVVLELKDDVSPCVIRSEFDRNFLALVMPMRL